MDSASFGATLFFFRQRVRLSQAEAARRAGISAGYYSSLENDKRVAPTADAVMRIADALEASARERSWLMSLADGARLTASLEASGIPAHVVDLIAAVRQHADQLQPAAAAQLRRSVMEAAMCK